MLKSPLLKKYCGSAKKAQGPAKSRKGKRVSWKYGDGTYSGTCIMIVVAELELKMEK